MAGASESTNPGAYGQVLALSVLSYLGIARK
jgi:hypothetical protein